MAAVFTNKRIVPQKKLIEEVVGPRGFEPRTTRSPRAHPLWIPYGSSAQ